MIVLNGVFTAVPHLMFVHQVDKDKINVIFETQSQALRLQPGIQQVYWESLARYGRTQNESCLSLSDFG